MSLIRNSMRWWPAVAGIVVHLLAGAVETVADGHHMAVETRDVTGYRTAYFSLPSSNGPGDTPRAAAILGVLDALGEAARRNSTTKQQ